MFMVFLFVALGILALLTPLIGARLIGMIWGGLLKLGIAGRIITTLITALPFIFLVVFFASDPAWLSDSFARVVVATIAFALTLLIPIWYFFWHYYAVESMGALEFGSLLKNFILIIMIGFIVGLIVAMFSEIACYIIIGASVIGGIIYYFVATKEHSGNEDSETKIRWISILAALGLTVAFFLVANNIPKVDPTNIVEDIQNAEIQNLTAVVIHKSAWVKDAPSYNGKTIFHPSRRSVVTITGEVVQDGTRYWIPIEQDGVRGYILPDYIRIQK